MSWRYEGEDVLAPSPRGIGVSALTAKKAPAVRWGPHSLRSWNTIRAG